MQNNGYQRDLEIAISNTVSHRRANNLDIDAPIVFRNNFFTPYYIASTNPVWISNPGIEKQMKEQKEQQSIAKDKKEREK